MENIRDLFHTVGNWHNKISVASGLLKIELSEAFSEKTVPKDMEEVMKLISDLEGFAIGASKSLNQLKDAVYELKPDTKKEAS